MNSSSLIQEYPRPPASKRMPLVRLEFNSIYYASIHAGVSRAAGELGWILDDIHCTGRRVPYLGNPDAILFAPGITQENPLEYLKKNLPTLRDIPLERLPSAIPIVCMLIPLYDAANSLVCPAVVLDWHGAGRMGARHLCSLRVPNIAYWRSGIGIDANNLWEGFCAETAANQKIAEEWSIKKECPTPFNCFSEKGRLWLQKKLAASPKPLAIMAADDRFAHYIIQAALDIGLKVPEDVAVMGAENNRNVQLKSPIPISTIDLNMEELGYYSAYLLNENIQGNKTDQFTIKTVPISRLIEQESTLTFSHNDPKVVAAALKIRNHYTLPISTSSLARELGMSPQLLHKKYLTATGSTVSQAIRLARLTAATALLKETNLKTEAIAVEVGLQNNRTFFRVFKDHFGMTPGQWRKSSQL